jgi:hypothetical protein
MLVALNERELQPPSLTMRVRCITWMGMPSMTRTSNGVSRSLLGKTGGDKGACSTGGEKDKRLGMNGT